MSFDPTAAVVTLRARFEGHADKEFIIHVWVLSALVLISLFVSAGSMLLRWRAEAFWVIRMNHGVIQPHSLVGWLLCSFVFAVIAIPYLWLTRGAGDPVTIQNALSFRALLYVPLWFGVWSMAIATMVAPFSLVHAQNRQNRHPFVLNFFIVAIPVLFLASLLTITVLGHFENAALFNDYLVLVKLIEESPIRAVEALAANAQMNVDSARIVSRWKNNWTVYSVFIGIALAVFLASSARYFNILLSSMRALREQHVQGSSPKLSSLGRAYASLIMTTVTTALIAALYLVLTCFVAITLGAKGNSTNLFSLVSIYIFAVFGGITNIVIFIRSILIYRNSNFSGGTLESKSASASRIGTHPILPLQKLRGSTSLSPIATGGSQLNFITITREWEVKVDTERTSLDTDSEKVERFDVDLGKAGVYGMSSRSEGPGWNVCFDR